MKCIKKNTLRTGLFLCLLACVVLSAQGALAASMSEYCATPPFIGTSTTPNMLMLIDNSASMHDLVYVDKGTATRTGTYCYDQTYVSAPTSTYTGYFETEKIYEYVSSTMSFTGRSAFPGSSECADTLIQRSGQVFVCYNATAKTVSKFAGRGNFLNWLTMSKFDIQKQILTGGKYDLVGQTLQAESRGCVGQLFIKEPLTEDYVEGGTNTSLGVTFGISGPTDPYNASAPSPGGQTYIKIFIGDYNQESCQAAINDFADPLVQKQDLIDDIGACIGYTATNRDTCQYNSTITCNNDADCGYSSTAGTCSAATTGTCGTLGGGVCGTVTVGTCSVSNGTCPAYTKNVNNGVCKTVNAGTACDDDTDCQSGSSKGTCERTCVGGGKAGAVCGTNKSSDSALCAFSQCTTGDTTKASCASAADCTIKKCTNAGPKNNQACTTNAGCDSGTCTAGNVGATCLLNSDCAMATSTCNSGDTGKACATDADCTLVTVGNGQCLPPATVQIKSTFGQNMHTCYQILFKDQDLQPGDLSTVSGNNGCNTIYEAYYTCNGGSKDGYECTGAADCPSGTCINGPNAIRIGSPVLICGKSYAGYCASSADSWATTNWNPMEYTSADACVTKAIENYCSSTQATSVVDPTANADSTSEFANLPAILGGTGLQGQLGNPLTTMPVQVAQTSEPTGLVQQYDGQIRMGAMIFNPYGSPTECVTSSATPTTSEVIACPKICSTDPTRLCGSAQDCPFPTTASCYTVAQYTSAGLPRTCYSASSLQQASPVVNCSSDANCGIGQACIPGNTDAAKLVYYIGYGYCELSPTTACATDAHCTTTGDQCINYSVASRATGTAPPNLVDILDSIKGASWTPFSEAFYNAIGYFAKKSDGKSRTDLRINASDFKDTLNPSEATCQDNNILFITDGSPTADQYAAVDNLAKLYTAAGGATSWTTTCPKYKGSVNLDNLAWIANKRNITSFSLSSASTATPTKNYQKINTYVVSTGEDNGETGECNNLTLLSQTAVNGGTTLQSATNPEELQAALAETFESISKKAASGSAVSVLTTSSRGVGSMLQAYFLPEKTEGAYTVNWLGYTQNIWIDTSDDLREDTTNDAQLKQDLVSASDGDRVMRLFLDTSINLAGETKAAMFTTDEDGNGGSLASCSTNTTVPFESITPIWEGGKMLARMSAGDRYIFTAIPTSVSGLNSGAGMNTARGIALTETNLSSYPTLSAALNWDATYSATNILRYTRGEALEETYPALYRSRLLPLVVSGTTTTVVWKLGDIINATPKVLSNLPQNTYTIDYGDSTYYDFISGDAVKQRTSIALVGANDGMLHAFRVGYLKDKEDDNGALPSKAKALFRDSYGSADNEKGELGKEMWAYVPYSALPYLKYYADPNYGDCHIFSIDLSVKVYDMSLGHSTHPNPGDAKDKDSWHTILIGGMRFGGACTNTTTIVSGKEQYSGYPLNTPVSNAGFSSYFALDITDTENPKPLWEFTDADLGYTTSAPAIIRTGGTSVNGYWYAVFGSGPTQLPTQTRDIARTKKGYLYILPMKYSSSPLTTTPIKIALADNEIVGDVLVVDADKDYASEKLYFGTAYCSGYVWPKDKQTGAYLPSCPSGSWKGKIRGLPIPNQDLMGSPAWTPSLTRFLDVNYPFTASVDVARDTAGNTWVYAGSGKYYSGLDQADTSKQVFVGFIDHTYNPSQTDYSYPISLKSPAETTCPTSCSSKTVLCDVTKCEMQGTVPTTGGTIEACLFNPDTNSFSMQTIVTSITNPSTVPQSTIGWSIYLGAGEKSISRPLAVGGVVDFLTYVPSTDVCSHGGDSYLYAVDYLTGVASSNVAIRTVKNTTSDAGGTTASTSGNVYVQRKVKLGPGAPPSGEAIIITPPKEGQEQLKKKIQVATGVIVEAENKPQISTVSKILNWLKK